MAMINLEGIVESLGSDIKPALENAVRTVLGDVSFDSDILFREFCSEVGRQCPGFVIIYDFYVRTD